MLMMEVPDSFPELKSVRCSMELSLQDLPSPSMAPAMAAVLGAEQAMAAADLEVNQAMPKPGKPPSFKP